MRTINNIFTVLVMICIIFIIIIPLPRLFLEIAFGIELLLGIILYVYSKNNFAEKFQRRIPYLVLIYNLIILSVSNVSLYLYSIEISKLYLLSARQRTLYGKTNATIESRFIKEIID